MWLGLLFFLLLRSSLPSRPVFHKLLHLKLSSQWRGGPSLLPLPPLLILPTPLSLYTSHLPPQPLLLPSHLILKQNSLLILIFLIALGVEGMKEKMKKLCENVKEEREEKDYLQRPTLSQDQSGENK